MITGQALLEILKNIRSQFLYPVKPGEHFLKENVSQHSHIALNCEELQKKMVFFPFTQITGLLQKQNLKYLKHLKYWQSKTAA